MVVDQHPDTSILVNSHKNLDRNGPYPGFNISISRVLIIRWMSVPHIPFLTMALMNGLQMNEELAISYYFSAQKLAIKHLDISNKIRDTTFGNLTRYVTGSPLFHVRETGSWWVFLLQEWWTSKDQIPNLLTSSDGISHSKLPMTLDPRHSMQYTVSICITYLSQDHELWSDYGHFQLVGPVAQVWSTILFGALAASYAGIFGALVPWSCGRSGEDCHLASLDFSANAAWMPAIDWGQSGMA